MTDKAMYSGGGKIIYSLWSQGKDQAPGIVKLCLDRWQQLNPEYELRVLDSREYYETMRGFPIDPGCMTMQAGSDALRARLLVEGGGIWVDAALFPVRPLSDWLDDMVGATDFFAFSQSGKRPIASWFLVSNENSYIMRQWLKRVEAYWHKPRELSSSPFDREIVTFNPSLKNSAVPDETDSKFPYFWFHFLFRELIDTDKKFRQMWASCPKIIKEPSTRLRRLLQNAPNASAAEISETAIQSPVQKLDWREQYPLDILKNI